MYEPNIYVNNKFISIVDNSILQLPWALGALFIPLKIYRVDGL